MIEKHPHGLRTSSLLTSLGVIHGYSDKSMGDVRNVKERSAFLSLLGGNDSDIILAQQIHGNSIHVARVEDSGKRIPAVDGLVFKDEKKNHPVFLGVYGADCTPILAVDSVNHIIGAAHAGWKGTVADISGALIGEMKSLGADTKNIYVSIGPHIGMCCYSVPPERAEIFQAKFGKDAKMASRLDDVWHVDIGWANHELLVQSGVDSAHIDAPAVCTSCQSGTYFSYRKEPKASYGEQMGVIGIT